jgi:hypothetical protein
MKTLQAGDLVQVEPHASCNVDWGSAKRLFHTGKQPTLGVLIENKLEWYHVMMNDGRSGWIWFREVKPL